MSGGLSEKQSTSKSEAMIFLWVESESTPKVKEYLSVLIQVMIKRIRQIKISVDTEYIFGGNRYKYTKTTPIQF